LWDGGRVDHGGINYTWFLTSYGPGDLMDANREQHNAERKCQSLNVAASAGIQ